MSLPIWSIKESVILIFVVPMVTINSNNLTFLVCFEDICGYHGNKVTMATNVGLSSDRTL